MSSPRVSANLSLPPLRRRSLLALGAGGIAAGVLSGCGDDLPEPSEERDVELLSAALVGEENTASALAAREKGPDASVVAALAAQASTAADRLQDEISEIGARPAEGGFEQGGATGDEALEDARRHTNEALAAHRLGSGQLSQIELRRGAIQLAALAGARVAIIADLLGDEPAPLPFVTGGEEEPFVDPEAPEDAAEAGGGSPGGGSADAQGGGGEGR